MIEYGEVAKKEEAKGRDSLNTEKEFNEKIKKVQTDEKLTYSEATAKVILENPELAKTVESISYE